MELILRLSQQPHLCLYCDTIYVVLNIRWHTGGTYMPCQLYLLYLFFDRSVVNVNLPWDLNPYEKHEPLVCPSKRGGS